MERRHTGGTREIRYTKEDAERIRNSDTTASKDFKESYKQWDAQREVRKLKAEEQALEKQRKKMMIGLVVLIVFILILVAMRFWK